MNILLLPDGTMKTIGKLPFNLPTRTLSKRRVSTITPLFAPKKQAFHILRKLFGEDGRVAAWTRTWRTTWLVRIISTKEWSVFANRDAAISWELDTLYGDIDKWL